MVTLFTPSFLGRRFLDEGLVQKEQVSTGLIFQNKTPAILLPVLRRLDRAAPWGG